MKLAIALVRWFAVQSRTLYDIVVLTDLRRREKNAQVCREEIQPYLDVAYAASVLLPPSRNQEALIEEMISAAAVTARMDHIDSRLPNNGGDTIANNALLHLDK